MGNNKTKMVAWQWQGILARQRWRPGNSKAKQPGNGKDGGLITARRCNLVTAREASLASAGRGKKLSRVLPFEVSPFNIYS